MNSMNCPKDQFLHRFYDEELSPEDRHQVESHLASCSSCADRVRELQSIGNRIRQASFGELTSRTLVRWHHTVMDLQERSIRRLAGWMTAAASVVLVVSLYTATRTQAQTALSDVHDWEAAAVGIDIESASPDIATAQWIATDLSRTTSGGQP